MRVRSGIAIALASALAFAGVAGAAESGEVESIDYWYWQDDVTDPTIQNLADQFEQIYGIRVNIRDSVAQPQFYDSLVNAIAAGNAPDATHLNTNMFGQLLQAQMLEPLNEHVDAWAGKDDVIPTMWAFVTSPDGQTIFAMPNKFLMFYLYYRTDLFAEYGVEVPTTQEEFVAAAAALTDPDNEHWGFDIRGGPNGQDQWAAFLVAGGARFLDADGNVAFDSPETRTSNDLYISTYPSAPPGAINDGFPQIIANFQSGTAAMIINHLGAAKTLEASNGDQVGVALIPSATGDPSQTTYMGTMNANAVLASSDAKDAAFRWISFLAEEQPQLAITRSTNGYLPVVQSVAARPEFEDNRFFQVSVQAAQGAAVTAWPPIPGTTKATQQTWQPLFQGALLGQNPNDAVVEGVAATLAE